MDGKKSLPVDFKWFYIALVYVVGLAVTGYAGVIFGAQISLMIIALALGFFIGLPAARWELETIKSHWDEILSSNLIRLGLPYYPREKLRRFQQYFLFASFLIPLFILFLAYILYWRNILAKTGFGDSLFLLIRWNGWYYIPYILGLEFASIHFPRLVAVSSMKKIYE